MKYAGNITISDDQGNVVFERDLSADEMIAELLTEPIEKMIETANKHGIPAGDRRFKENKLVISKPDIRFGKGQRRCSLCLQPGHNARKCTGSGVAHESKPAPKTTPKGRSLDEEERAWREFEPDLTPEQYEDVRTLKLDGLTSREAAIETEHDIQQINFAFSSTSYDGYVTAARRAAFKQS